MITIFWDNRALRQHHQSHGQALKPITKIINTDQNIWVYTHFTLFCDFEAFILFFFDKNPKVSSELKLLIEEWNSSENIPQCDFLFLNRQVSRTEYISACFKEQILSLVISYPLKSNDHILISLVIFILLIEKNGQ